MSKRTATTLTIQVRLRVPPGSNAKAVVSYVESALTDYKHGLGPIEANPMKALDTDSMIVKIEKRETVYLN